METVRPLQSKLNDSVFEILKENAVLQGRLEEARIVPENLATRFAAALGERDAAFQEKIETLTSSAATHERAGAPPATTGKSVAPTFAESASGQATYANKTRAAAIR